MLNLVRILLRVDVTVLGLDWERARVFGELGQVLEYGRDAILTDSAGHGRETLLGVETEFLDLSGQEETSGRQEKGIDALERVLGIESAEVDGGAGDHLLPQLQLFAHGLYD